MHRRLTAADTQPVRAYEFPSCNACSRIAAKRGYALGDVFGLGRIEAFSHSAEGVQAIIGLSDGLVTMVTL